MLVLGRKLGEGVKFVLPDGQEIIMRVDRMTKSRVRFMIKAPQEIGVKRINQDEKVVCRED